MNVHESEKLAGILKNKGYMPSDSQNDAYILIFNTCCIRDTAEKKILGNIGAVKKQKKDNPNMIVAVVGCMSQQKGIKELLKEKYSYVDIVLGS